MSAEIYTSKSIKTTAKSGRSEGGEVKMKKDRYEPQIKTGAASNAKDESGASWG